MAHGVTSGLLTKSNPLPTTISKRAATPGGPFAFIITCSGYGDFYENYSYLCTRREISESPKGSENSEEKSGVLRVLRVLGELRELRELRGLGGLRELGELGRLRD